MPRLTLLGLLFCACLAAQRGAVDGIAVNGISGEPLPGVHVHVFAIGVDGPTDAYGAISGKDGHFSINAMPAGSYIFVPEFTGFAYVPPKGSSGIPNVSAKAAETSHIRIEMVPRGIIRGRVVDEYGDPVAQVSIELQAASPDLLIDILGNQLMGGNIRTDDRGEFRFSRRPGKYYVVAKGQSTAFNGAASTYGDTYFPAAPTKDQAAVVEAVSSREVAGIEIRLTSRRTYSLSGTVTGMPVGVAPNAIRVMLYRERSNQTRSAGGSFQFQNLESGTYRVMAQLDSPSGMLRSQLLEVRLDGVDGTASLALGPVGMISGTIGYQAPAGSALLPPTEKTTISLNPVQGSLGMTSVQARPDADGSFRIANPVPGKYRIIVEPMPDDAVVTSADVDGQAFDPDSVDLSRAPASKLKITLSHNAAQIAGKVLGKDGTPVKTGFIMVILTPDGVPPDGDRPQRAEPDGSYSLKGLRPGKYRLFALDAFEFVDQNNTNFLNDVAPAAELIEIKEGAHLSKDIKATTKESLNAKPKQ